MLRRERHGLHRDGLRTGRHAQKARRGARGEAAGGGSALLHFAAHERPDRRARRGTIAPRYRAGQHHRQARRRGGAARFRRGTADLRHGRAQQHHQRQARLCAGGAVPHARRAGAVDGRIRPRGHRVPPDHARNAAARHGPPRARRAARAPVRLRGGPVPGGGGRGAARACRARQRPPADRGAVPRGADRRRARFFAHPRARALAFTLACARAADGRASARRPARGRAPRREGTRGALAVRTAVGRPPAKFVAAERPAAPVPARRRPAAECFAAARRKAGRAGRQAALPALESARDRRLRRARARAAGLDDRVPRPGGRHFRACRRRYARRYARPHAARLYGSGGRQAVRIRNERRRRGHAHKIYRERDRCARAG